MTPQANDLRSVLATRLERVAQRLDPGRPCPDVDGLRTYREITDEVRAIAAALLHGGGGEAESVAGVEIGLMRERGIVEWYTNDGFSDDPPPPGTILYTTPPPQPRGELVLVPREPTEVMIESALRLQGEDAVAAKAPALVSALRKIYKAMFAAAPGEGSGECDACDGTGDLHRADGEYVGKCPHHDSPPPASQLKVAALIVRDVCELDPADPEDTANTVCVRVQDLQRIAEHHTQPENASQPAPSAGSGELPELIARLKRSLHDLGEHRQTHVVWRDWLLKDPDNEKVNPHAGSAEFHDNTIKDYDRHLANIGEAIRRLATAGQGVEVDDAMVRRVAVAINGVGSHLQPNHAWKMLGSNERKHQDAKARAAIAALAAPTPEQRG